MPKSYPIVIFGLLLAGLLAACRPDSPAVTPAATATPAPPTAPTPTIASTAAPPPLPASTSIPTAEMTAAPDSLSGRIVFYSERAGAPDIYRMNADGSDLRQLTDDPAYDDSPALSPDGTRIAFLTSRHDLTGAFPDLAYELYVMDSDGSHPRRLTTTPAAENHPAWAPDSRRISFDADYDGDGYAEIYVMDADGGNVTRLTANQANDQFADWAPDGKSLAFTSDRAGGYDLYVMAADGSQQRPLTTDAGWELFPAWSPDGTQIAFFACDVRCQPNRQDLYVMQADGSDRRRLTETPRTVDEDPAWSPDGRYLVFQSDRDGNYELYRMRADGTDQVRLTDNAGGDYWPAWGPTQTTMPLTLTLEKSAQTFPAKETYQIGLGDFDGDGDLDAVFANMAAHDSKLWLNDGTGVFTDSGQMLTRQGHGVDVGDLDGDGDLDLFMTCAHFMGSGKPSKVYLNDGAGVFQDSGQDIGDTDLSGNAVTLVDIDNDDDLDAHVMYYEIHGMPDKVYLNDGRGQFSDSGLALTPEDIAWGDVDDDGDVDIFSKTYKQGYAVWLNDGAGQFTLGWQMTDETAMYGGVGLGDFDGDGDLDALLANGFRNQASFPTRLLWNDGAGQFADSGQTLNATIGFESFAVGDLNGDGALDVYVAQMDLPDEVWLNDGNGTLLDSGLRLVGSSPRSMTTKATLGDLDGDGDLDAFVGAFGGQPEIWFNSTL
ncbi:MAG TPA: FG-GAP-like repeat-containing protein [Anaerolineae bacterium]|nr:FG-GAP-like repeat-containing protein [Anaerolineae bacterium]